MPGRTQPSRRTVLKGLGATVALPFLEAMLPRTAASTPAGVPKRMAVLYIANGVIMEQWRPVEAGNAFTLPRILTPLEPHRADMLVLSELSCAKGRGGGAHACTMPAYLSGTSIKKTLGADIQAGVTMDQFAAAQVGRDTRFSSLELGCEYGQQDGYCDTGYTCVYQTNLSWRTPTTPAPKEINPRIVFDRLFGGAKSRETSEAEAQVEVNRLSILDFVREQATDLNRTLGAADRRRMDEYLTSVREIERQIKQPPYELSADVSKGMARPTTIPAKFADHFRLIADLLVLAFQTDMTRIATLVLGNEGTRRTFPELGFTEEHHGVSHHGNDPIDIEKHTKINQHQVEQLAYFLAKMKAVREGDGTLLDNSMVLYGSGHSDGNRHGKTNLPTLVFGKGGGTLKPGRHVVYPANTPICNLYLSLFERMGVKADKFGDSTGVLPDLS
jgi:hypothetical protein